MPGQPLKKNSIRRFRPKAFIIFTHVLCWLLFLSLPVLFLEQGTGTAQCWAVAGMPGFWLFAGFYILLFYGNAYILLPYLFRRRRFFSYAGILLFLGTTLFFLKPVNSFLSKVNHLPELTQAPGQSVATNCTAPSGTRNIATPGGIFTGNQASGVNLRKFDIASIFMFILIIAVSLAAEISGERQTIQQRALEAKADKANAELSFLKAQINPHFLFNTLNNIYSLSVIKHESTPDAILKLSNIMRYVTEEAGADFVALKNETACIRNYIELQQLRLSKKVNLSFSIEGNLENKKVAPLIFMAFIENVFKYGISNREESTITIRLQAENDKITFYTQNMIFPHHTSLEREGIGITNTKERLQHLYPGKHTLEIKTEDGFFTVLLMVET